MGDKRRFDLFADFIADAVPDRDARIADVAAGRGGLTWSLRARGFSRVTPFEPAPRRGGHVTRLGMVVADFAPVMAKEFDVVVGMHPDGATDCILSGCALHGATAIVVPCCARPTAWTYWGAKLSFRDWTDHLVRRSSEAGLPLNRAKLKMSGRADVLWGTRDRLTDRAFGGER